MASVDASMQRMQSRRSGRMRAPMLTLLAVYRRSSKFAQANAGAPFVSRDSAIDLYSLNFEIDLTRN
jgi:hypothetical protein